ncbi:MAG TPA: aromatic ring-hydroxylating dioxygenase subunit alpha [Candidatus Binatia bacterium]|nr:aromatic ring-hydroxylating dioxygenase subunit alpha [Candidatus Binatia bacterium]
MGFQAAEQARIAYARACWYVACDTAALRKRPIARTLLGTPLVLFRGDDTRPAALLDRCAHRNLPLSEGKIAGGSIECPYHGWQYDAQGFCRRVPALAAAPEYKGRSVPAFAAVEQQGYVWVFMDPDLAPSGPPYRFPHLDDAAYGSIRFASEVEGTLHATLENMLDVPHTAFLHRGLFRGGPKRPITAIVRRFGDRAEAEYVGEPRPSGLAGRLLAPRGGTVVHFDRFLLPSIAQIEYRLDQSHLVVTNALTPVDDFHTRFVSVASFRLPLPSILVRLILEPLAKRIFRQDARILRLQTEAVRRFGGESYVSTEADLLGPHMWRLLKQAAETGMPPVGGAPEVERRVELHV